jgi:acyl-CoA hydrolase
MTDSRTDLKTDPTFHEHRLSMTVLMTPDMVNFSGKVHGGAVLRLLDQVAYACASRYSGHYVVTLSVDQVYFRQPIFVGELVTFLAAVNYTGRTSMEVGMKVIAEDARNRTQRHVMSSFFTMVAVDKDGLPIPVTTLQPKSEEEKRRFSAAQDRKKLRQDFEAAHHATRRSTKAIKK